RRDQRLDPFQIGLPTGQPGGIDGQEGLAEIRCVAILGEEGIGFEAEGGTGQRCAEQLEAQREHRSLGTTDWPQRAPKGSLRIGRWLTVTVEGPIARYRFAALRRQQD